MTMFLILSVALVAAVFGSLGLKMLNELVQTVSKTAGW